jgi:hypothetical protein
MRFTVEETNLMCIYDTGDRVTLIGQLREAMQDDMEPEMLEIAQSCITRLEAMTDEEYAATDLTADYEDGETEG